jgi:hypothetical protein
MARAGKVLSRAAASRVIPRRVDACLVSGARREKRGSCSAARWFFGSK